jgi:hypothetical protein
MRNGRFPKGHVGRREHEVSIPCADKHAARQRMLAVFPIPQPYDSTFNPLQAGGIAIYY